MYLGKVTGTGGEYFDNIEIRKITKEEIAKFDYINQGIDFGKIDPNVFLRTYIDTENAIGYVIKGIYQSDWDRDSKKSKYEQFADMVYAETRDYPDDTIWCDAQGDAQISILSGAPWHLPCEAAPKQGKNGRDAGGSYLQSLKKLVLDEDLPEEVIEELVRFEALPRPDGNGWLDKPGKKNDHSFDCLRYSEHEAIACSSISVEPEDD
jgi:hypothetical protein